MLKGDERRGCLEAYSMYEELTEEEKKKIPADFVEYIEKIADIKNTTQRVDLSKDTISSYGWTLFAKIAEYVTSK